MATNSVDQPETGARSGGKILRKRRMALKTTPYDRPNSPLSHLVVVNESPNWLSSATRILASGAGKLLSTVYSPDFSSSSSTSDSSPSDKEVSSESGHDGIYQEEDERLNNKDKTSSDIVPSLSKENKTTAGKKETRHVIEQLLMRETFSREEGDRLISIIESRVPSISALERDQTGKSTDIPPLCSSPEAKNWLEEKKLESFSKSKVDRGACSQNSAMLPYHTTFKVGSPVDVAKSYMRSRPRWATISPNSVEIHSPSPVMASLFGEDLPLSVSGHYLSSSKLKRDTLDHESWSMLKELRRVRAKASEDLLGSHSSSKLEWSPFDSGYKRRPKFLISDSKEMGRTPQDGFPTPVILSSEQNQDIEATLSIQGSKDSVSKENGSRDISINNGIPSSERSLMNVLDTVADQRPPEGQQSSSNNKINTSVHGGETCELPSEASVEVPITIHIDTGGTLPP